jgi:hypothetical protein
MQRQPVGSGALALVVLALLFGGCGSGEEAGTTATTASTATAEPPGPAAAHPRTARHPSNRRSRVTGSQAVPALGHQTKFTGCQVRGLLPDPACTPGAIFPSAAVSQICTPGYSQSVRNVPESLKLSVYAEYGIESHVPGSYEVDHLVALELGGSNSMANLWPEISPGYHEKDAIENQLHDAVCAGNVGLAAAQREIAHDWRHTFIGAPPGTSTEATPAAPSAAVEPPAGETPASFCTSHQCIPSFSEGHGTIVQCADGEWSHSGGRPGVCSRHGGPR